MTQDNLNKPAAKRKFDVAFNWLLLLSSVLSAAAFTKLNFEDNDFTAALTSSVFVIVFLLVNVIFTLARKRIPTVIFTILYAAFAGLYLFIAVDNMTMFRLSLAFLLTSFGALLMLVSHFLYIGGKRPLPVIEPDSEDGGDVLREFKDSRGQFRKKRLLISVILIVAAIIVSVILASLVPDALMIKIHSAASSLPDAWGFYDGSDNEIEYTKFTYQGEEVIAVFNMGTGIYLVFDEAQMPQVSTSTETQFDGTTVTRTTTNYAGGLVLTQKVWRAYTLQDGVLDITE
jgi:hypothetical protein